MTTVETSEPDPNHVRVLRSLSEQYARSADRRDPDGFAAVFHDDAQLHLHDPADSSTPRVREGIDDLRTIPAQLGRYRTTFHMLGQSTYDLSHTADGRATGETYCIAHHYTPGDTTDSSATNAGATNHVMYIRYDDDYRIGDDGVWRIELRRVRVDWTERRAAN